MGGTCRCCTQQWQCRSLQSNVLGGTWLWMCSSSKGRSIGLRLPPVSRHGSGFPLSPWMPRRTGRWVPTATAGLFRLDSAGIWIQYNSPSTGGARAACSDLPLVRRPGVGLNGIIHCGLQDMSASRRAYDNPMTPRNMTWSNLRCGNRSVPPKDEADGALIHCPAAASRRSEFKRRRTPSAQVRPGSWGGYRLADLRRSGSAQRASSGALKTFRFP